MQHSDCVLEGTVQRRKQMESAPAIVFFNPSWLSSVSCPFLLDLRQSLAVSEGQFPEVFMWSLLDSTAITSKLTGNKAIA